MILWDNFVIDIIVSVCTQRAHMGDASTSIPGQLFADPATHVESTLPTSSKSEHY